jgi:uncharacterized protein (TIGR03084 family)
MSEAQARLAVTIDDLISEQESLDTIVADLADTEWSRPTPSPGWSIADQISHLAYFDAAAVMAIETPDAFASLATALNDSPAQMDELTLQRPHSVARLRSLWRSGRRDLHRALRGLHAGERVSWFGPSMGAQSFVTARLMEAWAHGQDVADALETIRTPTDRLRHVAHLGYSTRAWSYLNRGLPVPAGEIAIELRAPSGALWRWGPRGEMPTVSGSALDFCLVVTQRRHLDDTDLVARTGAARDWLLRAQAFAGPPTDGPPSREANHRNRL